MRLPFMHENKLIILPVSAHLLSENLCSCYTDWNNSIGGGGMMDVEVMDDWMYVSYRV